MRRVGIGQGSEKRGYAGVSEEGRRIYMGNEESGDWPGQRGRGRRRPKTSRAHISPGFAESKRGGMFGCENKMADVLLNIIFSEIKTEEKRREKQILFDKR